jgi:hypothetical protein
MDIERLARKLEPLMPDQVAYRLRVQDVAGCEIKDLIEKEIAGTAHRVLGDFRKKRLLPLPPRKRAGGSLHLGTILYEKNKWDFGISQAELLRNMGIFGMSGCGKVWLCRHS